MSLQITSMADIFMILLVFLLKSFSTSVSSLSPVGNTHLPQVVTKGETIRDTLKLEVSQNALMIDEKTALKLENFQYPAAEIDAQGNVDTMTRLLMEQRKHMPNPNMEADLLVLADEKTPYSTIKPILASAAQAGFVDLQLVAVAKE